MKWEYVDPKIDYDFDIPPNQYKERVNKVRNILKERKVELAVAWGLQLFPGDIIYLSGFDINLEIGAMILLTQENLYLLTGPESYPAAVMDIKNGETFGVVELGAPGIDYERTPGITKIKNCIEMILKKQKPKRIAFLTFKDFMTTLAYDSVLEALPVGTEASYETDILYKMRLEKSPAEQKLMEYAAAIATEGLKAVLNYGKPGLMEVQWGAPACAKMRELGAHALTFDPVIQSGERINTCIGKTYNKVVKDGEIISINVGCRYKHYAGHIGRSVVAGKPSKKQLEFLRVGAEATAAAGSQIIFNTPMANMDRASHEIFIKNGYGEYDRYSCGHGTGFTDGIGEGTATQKSKGLWPKNIAMMTDVSLYGVPKFYGFRMEDGFIIDDSGITHKTTDGLPLDVFKY